jgi:hypothetical protein
MVPIFVLGNELRPYFITVHGGGQGMIGYKSLLYRNCNRINSFIIAAVICVLLTLPGKADAGWIEDQFNAVQSKLNSLVSNMSTVRSRVTNVYSKVVGAAGTINDGKVKNLISDMQVMLQAAVDTQQEGVAAFMAGGDCVVNDGTPCGFFRADLIDIVHIARGLNNQILALHNIPGLDLQIQDLGLADLINKLPGRALLPLYKVLTKTQFLTPALIDAMQTAGDNIDNLKTVLFIEDVPSLPTPLEACQFVDANSKPFKISANAIKGIGVVLKVLGKLFEALGKTPAGGPNEVDAGIHGYVHATVKTNTLGTIGKILGGISGPMSSVSSFVSDKVSSCGDMVRDAEVETRQLQMLTNQDAILASMGGGTIPNPDLIANQLLILEGQLETRCAFRKNKPKQCKHFRGNGFGGKKKPLP